MRLFTEKETESAIRSLRVYGYCQIPAVLTPSEVSRFKSMVEADYAKRLSTAQGMSYAGVPERDAKDKMVYNLQYKNHEYLEPLGHPGLVEVLKQFLNDPYYRFLPPEVPNYILSYYNARSSGNFLDLHIDSFIPTFGDRTWLMQVVFVLDEFTEDNGATLLVPGSHLSGKYTDRSLPESEMVTGLAKPGDLLIWDSRLWHGTKENRSGASRWAMIATLSAWWLKQTMDIPRGLPQEIYERLSPEQKRLLGFCSIPPRSEAERINTKSGYDALKPRVSDYF